MNTTEHLLVCLAEECAEVQQAVAKALRFGLQGGINTTNAEEIAREVSDLMAVLQLLEGRGIIEQSHNVEAIEQKKSRVVKYMEHAKTKGTLID
ncbi:MAG: hypothetical protein KF753_19100 [Caldilineaceae bacterium]|nr:hypothetical protein [Caldilineaceae bacterium]